MVYDAIKYREIHIERGVSGMYTQLLSHVQFTDPMDCSRPGSSVHGIFQARILEWVAISYSDIRHKILEKIKFFKKFTEVIFGVCVCVCVFFF